MGCPGQRYSSSRLGRVALKVFKVSPSLLSPLKYPSQSWNGLTIIGLRVSSDFRFQARVGLGYPEFDLKPVGL